jgi:hypothetical protein
MPLENLVKVADRKTSKCVGCGPYEACEDVISTAPITFPAYKNQAIDICYNDDTVRNVIKHTPRNMIPRDPTNRAEWNLPEELLNVEREDPGNNDDHDHIDDLNHFDPEYLAHLYRSGLCAEAIREYTRTVIFAPNEYRSADIIVLWEAGMTGIAYGAWHLHILKTRGLSHYHGSTIVEYLSLDMNQFATSLHDRTIWSAKMFNRETITTMVKMFGYGLDGQAIELFELTSPPARTFDEQSDIAAGFLPPVDTTFDWEMVLALLEAGMSDQADTLFDNTHALQTAYNLDGIEALAGAGYKEYAICMSDQSAHFLIDVAPADRVALDRALERGNRVVRALIASGLEVCVQEVEEHMQDMKEDYDINR